LHFAVGWPALGGALGDSGRDDGGAERPCVLGGAAGGAASAGADPPISPEATPPWCEQAPLPPFDSDPSLHFTIGAAAGGGAEDGLAAGSFFGAGAALVSASEAMPPWCEQAPLPPFDVVPSLQVTVDSVSATAIGIRAAPAVANTTRMSHFNRRMIRLLFQAVHGPGRPPSGGRRIRSSAASGLYRLRVLRFPVSRFAARLILAAAAVLAPGAARAVDPFEIQVYDGAVNAPGQVGIETHINSVIAGHSEAVAPELPSQHQSHFTAEFPIGITSWWEGGVYLQTALLADGSFRYAGNKLRSKFVLPARDASPFRWGVNLEVSRLPEEFDRDRWGAEIRPIATWTSTGGRVFVSVNPIVDLSLAGPGRGDAPAFEPAVNVLYVVDGLASFGLEYYADLGPIGSFTAASAQEHYLYEVVNLLKWKRLELNAGVGEGLTDGSNRFVAKMIVGFR